MTSGAIDGRMCAPQGKLRGMFEDCLVPVRRHRGMTLLAVETEVCEGVIRVCRCIEIIYMTPLAFDRRIGELVAALRDMAGIAIDYDMHAYQRKTPLDM